MPIEPTSASRRRRARPMIVVAALASATAFAGVFSLPPLDRDEARFAQATAQMLESGDFVTIRFQEAERNKKPAGVHWLQAASVATFSTAEAREIWAYRVPSAIAAVLACLFTAAAGARLFGREVGMYAGLLLAAAPVLAGESAIAKTDAALLAATAGAFLAFTTVYTDWRRGRPAGWAAPAAFWVALAAGALLKGPIAPMVAGLAAAALAIGDRGAPWLARLRPFSGAALFVGLVAPWAIAIGSATEGRFFADALGGDMANKLKGVAETHGGPPGYHLALLPLLFWPAAALAPAAAAAAIRRARRWPTALLLAWTVPAFAVFELAPTKLPHYTLPLYPGLAILAAFVIAARGRPQTRSLALFRAGAVLFALIGAGAAALCVALPHLYRTGGADLTHAGAAALVAAAGALAFRRYWRGDARAGTRGAVGAATILAFALLQLVLPGLDRLQVSQRLAAAVTTADAPTWVALAGYHEPSAVFLLGTATVLTDGAGAAQFLAATPRGIAIVERREAASFNEAFNEAFGSDTSTVRLRALAQVDGYNYSKGDPVALTLYGLDP